MSTQQEAAPAGTIARRAARSDESNSTVSVGNVFVRNSARMPECLGFVSEQYASWKKLVDVSGHTLELMARRAGWCFSYLTSMVEAASLGLTRNSATQRAIEKVTDKVERCGFNARIWFALRGRSGGPAAAATQPLAPRPISLLLPQQLSGLRGNILDGCRRRARDQGDLRKSTESFCA